MFHLTVSYAFTMLKWTACENLPSDLDSCEAASAATAAAAAGARYVTMLFNDETHTYEQVDTCCISLLSVLIQNAMQGFVHHTDYFRFRLPPCLLVLSNISPPTDLL